MGTIGTTIKEFVEKNSVSKFANDRDHWFFSKKLHLRWLVVITLKKPFTSVKNKKHASCEALPTSKRSR